MADSSRGNPGRQTTGTPATTTSNPGASPAGLGWTRAPAGTRTWRSWMSLTRVPARENQASRRARAASSITGGAPASLETQATVRGPPGAAGAPADGRVVPGGAAPAGTNDQVRPRHRLGHRSGQIGLVVVAAG